MPEDAPRNLYERYASAVAYIAVRCPDERQSIGSAFHVGDGVFLTARHVVENNEILEIATTVGRYEPDPNGNITFPDNDTRFRHVGPQTGTLRGAPFFHPDPRVDVAALIVDCMDVPTLPLGSHLVGWLNDDAFILRPTVVMGYPPVPLSPSPTLIASHADVSAIVDPYHTKHPHFILSVMARDGFSGGPCVVGWNFVLGLLTSSFVENHQPSEMGYLAAVSVEPLLVCLAEHKLLPVAQRGLGVEEAE